MLPASGTTPIIGITGPPGAGKSTLVSGLLDVLVDKGLRVAVLAVDPTSPFTHGSLLGDRIRMPRHFNSPNVFIRSVATRGSLGGLSARTIEMADVLRAAAFDCIFVETVGVGQSEVEIAGLADLTVLVLVPGAGDEIQDMKSGIMEIADVFVVNKADRPGADACETGLRNLLHQKGVDLPVIKISAETGEGIGELADLLASTRTSGREECRLLAARAYRIIREQRMADISPGALEAFLATEMQQPGFNFYRFTDRFSGRVTNS